MRIHADPDPGAGAARARAPRRAGRDKGDVLTAAVRVIAQRGAESTRFTDVAQASGVPVSTLQYYFGSREDLLVAAFRHASETELAALRSELSAIADPWERLVLIVDRALADYAAGQGGHLWIEAWRFATRDGEMRADVLRDYAAWRAMVAGAVRDGVAAGRFRAGADPRRVAVLLVSLLDGLGMPLALGDPGLAAAEARDACLGALAAAVGHELATGA
jgi:AcrR family transcriptional regulator